MNVLWELFIIFSLARLAGEAMIRVRQPPVVGELLVGVAIGGHALGWVHSSDVLEAVAEMGVVFLLFEVGLHSRLSELRAVGSTAAKVAVSGVAVPFAAGFGLLWALGHAPRESLFLGAALVATSVGVTARVLAELGALGRKESQVMLGAAVVDDVLGLLVLAAVAAAAQGKLSVTRLAALGAEAAFFLVFVAALGTRLVRRYGPLLGRLRIEEGPFAFGVVICLGLSALAGRVGLAAVVGAFLAGVVLAEVREHFEIEQSVAPVSHFLTPFFFVLTGMAVDARALSRPGTAALGAAVLLLAVAAKFVPCAIAARRLGGRGALVVGVGMVPRGEVGIIVASVALQTGTVGEEIYTIVVAMSVLTTLVAPPALKALMR